MRYEDLKQNMKVIDQSSGQILQYFKDNNGREFLRGMVAKFELSNTNLNYYEEYKGKLNPGDFNEFMQYPTEWIVIYINSNGVINTESFNELYNAYSFLEECEHKIGIVTSDFCKNINL